jgi:hypothetical protein
MAGQSVKILQDLTKLVEELYKDTTQPQVAEINTLCDMVIS